MYNLYSVEFSDTERNRATIRGRNPREAIIKALGIKAKFVKITEAKESEANVKVNTLGIRKIIHYYKYEILIYQCIYIYKEYAETLGYRLINTDGEIVDFDYKRLCQILKKQDIIINNLQLNAKFNSIKTLYFYKNIAKPIVSEDMIRKANMLGMEYKELMNSFGNKMVILGNTLYIPDYIGDIPVYTGDMLPFKGTTLKVIGGRGLADCGKLFNNLNLDLLDLSQFDISNIMKSTGMFVNCNTKVIKVKNPRLLYYLKRDNFRGKIIQTS